MKAFSRQSEGAARLVSGSWAARSAWPCVYYDISQSRGEISVGGCLGDSAVGLCCLCLLCHGMVGLPQSHGPLVVFLAKSKDGITFLALNDYLASFLYH